MGITIIVCLGLLGTTMGGTRYTRDTTEECKKAQAEFDDCTKKAWTEYQKEFQKGDDKKKPDWMARKACNYMTESVEVCGNKLVGTCHTQEEVNKQKDEQLKEVLEQVKKGIPTWNSDKCPAMKDHLDRLAAAEAGEAEPTGSATSVQVSVLIFLAMTLIV